MKSNLKPSIPFGAHAAQAAALRAPSFVLSRELDFLAPDSCEWRKNLWQDKQKESNRP